MEFFTSPEDLMGWVKVQESPDFAANKIIELIGQGDEQDIVDTCNTIFNAQDKSSVDNASKILFGVLAKHNITNMKKEAQDNKMKKEAQIYRGTAPFFQSMPVRICPKLPATSNQNPSARRAISTFHCRENCLDSFTFDDDPMRVYCAEALWRQHVMDKFSHEWRDDDGHLVGGYINERFQVYHDDGGNQMALSKDERTRLPRPHQYSTERRLSEARGEETSDITLAKSSKMVKLASSNKLPDSDEDVYSIFNDIVEMKEAGINDEDILTKVSEHYGISIFNVAKINQVASKLLQRHAGTVYSYKNIKTAQVNTLNGSTLVSKKDVQVVSLDNNQPTVLKAETPVVVNNQSGSPQFEIVDGPDAGKKFALSNPNDLDTSFGAIDDLAGSIQDAASEVGLNEEQGNSQKDFPVIEE